MKYLIKIPATSANLGPGFDAFGLALDLWNETTVAPAQDFSVHVTGEGDGRLSRERGNLIVRAAQILGDRVGRSVPPFYADCVNRIPLGAGLGSSAAAALTGLLAGNVLLGNPMLKEEMLALASEMEGHPDNVAPALMGGLVVSTLDEGKVIARSIPMGGNLRITVVVPDFHLSTRQAREALPKKVTMEDAVHNISRAVLVMEAFRNGDLDLLGRVMTDRLHQPHRLRLIPGGASAMDAAREAGAAAVALSGAGPSLIAFSKTGSSIGESMKRTFEEAGVKARVFQLGVSSRGAEIQIR